MTDKFPIWRFTGIGILAFGLVYISSAVYFEITFTLGFRGLSLLALTSIWMLFAPAGQSIKVPVPLVLLLTAMVLSLTQLFAMSIFQDLAGMAGIAFSAVLLLNALKPTDAINAIAAGTMLIALYSVWSLLWSTNAWLEGKFVGPFGHWTSIGLALLAGLPSVMLINGKPKALIWILRITSIALIGWLIYLTSSRTSWLTFIAVLIFVGLSFLWKNYRRLAISATIVTAALLILVIANWSQSLALLGKNDTITGRTEIWTTIVQHLTDSPFVGIGWSRTFTPEQPFFVVLQEGAGFPAFHSHNDLLHWSLTTGVFGLLSFLLIVVLIASAAIVNAKSLSSRLIAIWLGASLLELLISGVTEISSFLPTGIFMLAALGTVGVVTTQSSPLRLRISLKRQ